MRRRFRRFRARVRAVVNYLIGEFYCSRFHSPLFSSLPGFGGTDVWGRRRREYRTRTCSVCGRSWEKNGSPKPLTPEQEKAVAKALGSSWAGKEEPEPHLVPLTPHEVEQLLAIYIHSLTFAGNLISSRAEKSLREKGLVDRMEGWAVITNDGEKWLKCSGLAYKFEKKAGDVR